MDIEKIYLDFTQNVTETEGEESNQKIEKILGSISDLKAKELIVIIYPTIHNETIQDDLYLLVRGVKEMVRKDFTISTIIYEDNEHTCTTLPDGAKEMIKSLLSITDNKVYIYSNAMYYNIQGMIDLDKYFTIVQMYSLTPSLTDDLDSLSDTINLYISDRNMKLYIESYAPSADIYTKRVCFDSSVSVKKYFNYSMEEGYKKLYERIMELKAEHKERLDISSIPEPYYFGKVVLQKAYKAICKNSLTCLKDGTIRVCPDFIGMLNPYHIYTLVRENGTGLAGELEKELEKQIALCQGCMLNKQ